MVQLGASSAGSSVIIIREGEFMSEFLGHVYNYDVFESRQGESEYFRSLTHAGDDARDFTLPGLSGDVKLSSLRGTPVVIEFGSIT